MLVKIKWHEEDRIERKIVGCNDSNSAKDKKRGLGYPAARTSPLPYRVLIGHLLNPAGIPVHCMDDLLNLVPLYILRYSL